MKLRGALIGLGNIAVRGHVPAYGDDRVRERIELVAVMDVVESNPYTMYVASATGAADAEGHYRGALALAGERDREVQQHRGGAGLR